MCIKEDEKEEKYKMRIRNRKQPMDLSNFEPEFPTRSLCNASLVS